MQRKPAVQQITEGVIWKQLLIFFFPILLGTFFQQMYNTVDTIIVGRFVGTTALASVGATSAFINLLNGFFIGLSSGATVILSQLFGARDRKGVHRALHTGMTLSFILGIMITVLGLLAGPTILKLIQTPASCMDGAVRYCRIYFIGAIASMVYNMGSGILRAMGDSKRPMIFLVIACLLNVVMDLIWVVKLDMGIEGAAIATVISQVVSAVLVVSVLLKLPKDIRFSWKDINMDWHLLKQILYIGIPAGVQFITFDLSNLLIQSGINSFGETAIAAWTAMNKTDAIIWMISSAFGVAITTFVGQNFGCQKYKRIRKSVWTCLGMSVFVVGSLSILLRIFGKYILGIYSDDPDVIKVGSQILMLLTPFYITFMPVEVFAGTMRGTGYSLVPTLVTCICICVFRVLWVLLVVAKYHTITLLALSHPISWILCSIVLFIVYFQGGWLHTRIAACGMDPE